MERNAKWKQDEASEKYLSKKGSRAADKKACQNAVRKVHRGEWDGQGQSGRSWCSRGRLGRLRRRTQTVCTKHRAHPDLAH